MHESLSFKAAPDEHTSSPRRAVPSIYSLRLIEVSFFCPTPIFRSEDGTSSQNNNKEKQTRNLNTRARGL